MNDLLKFSYHLFQIILFIVVFFGLLASPIIYINLKQRFYFKKLSNKLNLKLDSGTKTIQRSFPKVYGKIKNTKVYIQASILGEYTYNAHFNTHKYASPVVVIDIEMNNSKVKKFKITQKQEFNTSVTSNFDTYFEIDMKYEEKKGVFLNNSIKQKIINYTKKHPYFNVELVNNHLISIANYELINNKKYLDVIERLTLLMDIHKKLER